MKVIQKIIFMVAALVLVFAGWTIGSLIAAVPVWLLWNWVGQDVLAVKQVTYWQAWGLCLLCSCLFKNHSTVKEKE